MIFLERLIEKYNTLLNVNKNFKEASNYSREFVVKVQLLEDGFGLFISTQLLLLFSK